jgi:hypothetical protein
MTSLQFFEFGRKGSLREPRRRQLQVLARDGGAADPRLHDAQKALRVGRKLPAHVMRADGRGADVARRVAGVGGARWKGEEQRGRVWVATRVPAGSVAGGSIVRTAAILSIRSNLGTVRD